MGEVTWTHPEIARILAAIPVGVRSLLDVGTGTGIIGALCRVYREPERIVGVDGYAPYVERVRAMRFYDEVHLLDFARNRLPFDDQEFETVTCIEVIEHLERVDGLNLLDELERVGQTVVVTTPNWFFDQEALDENELQRHRSLWSVRDFRARGYEVTGIGGTKVFGRRRKIVSRLLAPLGEKVPALSTSILCVRRGEQAIRTTVP